MRRSHARRFVPGWNDAPAAERADVRLLHEILGLLPGARDVPGDAVHLIGETERILLKAHTVARLGREPLRVLRLIHEGNRISDTHGGRNATRAPRIPRCLHPAARSPV